MHQRRSRPGPLIRITAVTGCAALASALAITVAAPGMASAGQPSASGHQPASRHQPASCHLGNGIKHVVQLGFDNVHFFRDNPNVPSDLQMMPNLLHFFESNGTFLSNSHTPLIAHTGDDLLTTATGLYGDRHGMPITNGYQAYNADGTTDPAGTFAYWTDPIFDTAAHPSPGHDTNPSMVYSPVPPATRPGRPGPGHRHPGPVGAVHQGRLQRRRGRHGEPGTREHRGGHPQGVRPELAGGEAARPGPGLLQGPRDR